MDSSPKELPFTVTFPAFSPLETVIPSKRFLKSTDPLITLILSPDLAKFAIFEETSLGLPI